MVASIIKTTKLNQVPSITNLGSTGGLELIRWGYVENAIIIITSSIPCIRPLIISSVRKISSGGFSRSYELSGPYNGARSDQNKPHHSHSLSRGPKSPNPKQDSVERILGPGAYVNTARSESPTESHTDASVIKKQVDISVVSNESSGSSGYNDHDAANRV